MSELRIAVMAVLTMAALLAARHALGEEFTARWVNAHTAPAPATVLILEAGRESYTALVDCDPGERCETVYDLPPGEYDARLRSAGEGTELSPYSTVEHIVVEADPEPPPPPPNACSDEPLSVRADFNDDGAVTTIDFGYFLRAFRGE